MSEKINAHPGADRGYALDFISVIRHVASRLDEANPRSGLTIHELAATYQHVIWGDLQRVRLHHGLSTNGEAVRFLVDRAVSALSPQVKAVSVRSPGRYKLAVPFDSLRYEGQPIHRQEASE